MRIRHVKGAEEAVAANPLVINEPAAHRGNWADEVFGNNAPIHLEVGMGMGIFIRTSSFQHRDINYIGFEINTTVLYKSLRRYEAERARNAGGEETDIHNLRFIRSDARFLMEYFARGEVDRIYLNFSDPWPKDKNANKRLTSPHFLETYEHILKPEGHIEFKTDNEALFDYSSGTFSGCGWCIEQSTRDLHKDPVMNIGNIMTEYEAKFSAMGNPVFKLIASKKY